MKMSLIITTSSYRLNHVNPLERRHSNHSKIQRVPTNGAPCLEIRNDCECRIMPDTTIIKNKDQLKAHYDRLLKRLDEGKSTKVEIIHETRTDKQNNALHLYLSQVAKVLNDKGITFEMFFKEGYQVEWSMEIVKNECWRPIQKALTGKQSTTKPKTADYIDIYEYLNRKLAEHGVHVPWPSARG